MSSNNKHIEKMVERYKDDFSRTSFYGVSITELNEGELRAMICFLGEQQQEQIERHSRSMELMSELRRVK